MRSEPKQVLKAMFDERGDRIARDPELCEALLRDGCGDCRKEVAILVNTVKCGAAQELYTSTAPYASLRARLIQRVQDDQGLSADAAAWGIDTWREALTGSAAESETPPPPPRNDQPRAEKAEERILGLPPAADIVRDWRSGQETPVIKRAMIYVKQNAGDLSDNGPKELLRRLVSYGIPGDIAEQMILKAFATAGGSMLASGIGMFLMGIFIAYTSGGTLAFLLILVGAGLIGYAIYQRHKWRKWLVEMALRNTGAA